MAYPVSFSSSELVIKILFPQTTGDEFPLPGSVTERDLGVSRITAANYLNKLAKDGILTKQKLGTGNYYINEKLYAILTKKIL